MIQRSTRQAATILGIPPGRLSRAIWDGRVPEPSRSPSGNFLWTEHDIRRASWVLLGRDFNGFEGEQGGGESGNG